MMSGWHSLLAGVVVVVVVGVVEIVVVVLLVIQGQSWQTVFSKLALRDRNMQV